MQYIRCMYIDSPEVRALVNRAFPQYKGKSFRVSPFEGPMHLHSYWDGGSRNYWCAVRLTDGATSAVPENGTMFTPAIGECKELPADTVLIQYHAGNHEYCEVYVKPENLNRFMLPAAVQLSREESIVLVATRTFKNSYAGRANCRFFEANEVTKISLAEWEAAKAGLKSKGLLNKAGAITDAGRNAIGNTQIYAFKPTIVA